MTGFSLLFRGGRWEAVDEAESSHGFDFADRPGSIELCSELRYTHGDIGRSSRG